jgi:hypothetical protein
MPFAVHPRHRVATCAWLLTACTSATPSPGGRPHSDLDAQTPSPIYGGRARPDGASDAADGGNRPVPRLDAGPAVSPDEDLPQRDPDAGVRSKNCGTLEPWTAPSGVTALSVLHGGDGFAGLHREGSGATAYVFDSLGNATLRIGRLYESADDYGLVGASASNGVTVAPFQCKSELSGCEPVVMIAGQPPRTAQGQAVQASVTPSGKIVVASLLDGADPENQSYDMRLLDRTGSPLKRNALPVQDFTLIDMAAGDAGSVLLLGRQADRDANDGIDEVLVSLDENLKQRGVMVLKPHRLGRAVMFSREGLAIVVGTAIAPDGSRLWLDAFDAITLKEAWAGESIGSPGVGLAAGVATSGEIATLATTGGGDGFVVQKHDSEGVAAIDASAVAKIDGTAAMGSVSFTPGLAFQSDGSIFVTTPIGAFVSCP